MSNNGIVNIHGKDYVTVSKRIELWLKEAKEKEDSYSVETEVLSHSPIVVKATVTWGNKKFTGMSSVDMSNAAAIEKQNPYEVAETSAVGRALGFAGYGSVNGDGKESNNTNLSSDRCSECGTTNKYHRKDCSKGTQV